MQRVQNKVAIITGAASGVGAEDARLFASEGAKVVLTDINEEAGQALAKEIGEDALFLRHDIAEENDWKTVITKTEERFGGVDILVNNAGILLAANIAETELDVWQKIMRVNADGIRTPMIMGLMQNEQPGTMPEVKDPNQAMTRMAEPRDIANMVLYLASDESRFVNGAEMRIDNGWTVWADR